MKTTPETFDFDLDEILKQTEKEVLEVTDEALDDAAELMKDKLKAATPIGKSVPHLADKWRVKKLDKKRKISNSKNVKSHGRGVPLVNILEYSTSHGHPFVEKTVKENTEAVMNIFKNDLKGKL